MVIIRIALSIITALLAALGVVYILNAALSLINISIIEGPAFYTLLTTLTLIHFLITNWDLLQSNYTPNVLDDEVFNEKTKTKQLW